MAGTTYATINHKIVRNWAEARGGRPAAVRDTIEDGDVGILRFLFIDEDDSLEEITWDEFFQKFDEADLELIFQEESTDGEKNRFAKFVRRAPGGTYTTTDHETIQTWAEALGGRPAAVSDTIEDDDAGILRFDFEDDDDSLKELSWDEFFEKFDESNLAMIYQIDTVDGEESRFYKFVDR